MNPNYNYTSTNQSRSFRDYLYTEVRDVIDQANHVDIVIIYVQHPEEFPQTKFVYKFSFADVERPSEILHRIGFSNDGNYFMYKESAEQNIKYIETKENITHNVYIYSQPLGKAYTRQGEIPMEELPELW